MNQSNPRIKGLGEVSLIVKNLDMMQKFYEEVIGLDVIGREAGYVFFRIADGYGGHSQNLALFAATELGSPADKSPEPNSEQTTLHHIALNIALDDYEAEKRRLEGLGLNVRADVHEWLHVRSLYFHDPEGNTLEFVCYDPSVG